MHDVNIVMFRRFTPTAYPMKKNKLLLVPLIMFHYVESATKHTYATLKNRLHLFHNNYSYCYEVYTYYLFFITLFYISTADFTIKHLLIFEIIIYVILNLLFSNFLQLYNVKIHYHKSHKKIYYLNFLYHF